VFISFAFLTFFPFGLFAVATSATALSCDACDAALRVGLLARLDRRGSGLISESLSEQLSSKDIFGSTLGVLES
jgi:hypothetical protein